MARNNGLNFNLPSVDDLFSTEESRAEARLKKVVNLNPSEISDFPDHPFKVRMDAAMQEMAESVKQYGVLVPALVRPKQGGGYEGSRTPQENGSGAGAAPGNPLHCAKPHR